MELFALWKSLQGGYDLLIDLSLQREYSFYGCFFLRIPKRIGFNFKNRGIFLTRSLPLVNGFEGAHAVDFYSDLGKLIGLEIEDRFLEFYLSKQDYEELEGVFRRNSISSSTRFLVVAPGGGESWGREAVLKRWPAENFSELLLAMKSRTDYEKVLVVGSRDERQVGEEIQRIVTLPVVNLAGELSLGGCAAVLSKALLLLANDGGLVHLARALHVPCIAFYGPVDPRIYGPYPPSPEAVSVLKENLPCQPCYRRFRYNSACVDRECLTSLTPLEVVTALDARNYWSVLCRENFARAS